MATKKKKKKPRGKQKGNGFERKVMSLIVSAFAEFGITPTDAFRSILSGGHKQSFGDISLSSSLAALFPFATECKWHKKVTLYQFLTPYVKMGKSCKFKLWWEQTLEGSNKSKMLKPLLVFKGNLDSIHCIGYLYDILPLVSKDGLSHNIFDKKKIPIALNYDADKRPLVCIPFETLLKLLVKKGLHEKVHGTEGNRIRLRPQNSASRKQVSAVARASRKASHVRVRSAAS